MNINKRLKYKYNEYLTAKYMWERSPGEGNGNLLQYSCLENSMDRGAWWATAHGVAKELDSPPYQ